MEKNRCIVCNPSQQYTAWADRIWCYKYGFSLSILY